MPSAPPNIGTSVLRVLHRIQRQLTDLRERLDRGPRQIRAAEAHVQHCEDRTGQDQGRSQVAPHGRRQAATSIEVGRRQGQGPAAQAQRRHQQPRVSGPAGADRRRRDDQQRAGRRNPRSHGEVRRLSEEHRRGGGGAGRRPDRRPRKSAARWPSGSRRCGPTSPGSKPSCGNRKRPCRTISASCTTGSCGRRARTPWRWSKTSTAAAATSRCP